MGLLLFRVRHGLREEALSVLYPADAAVWGLAVVGAHGVLWTAWEWSPCQHKGCPRPETTVSDLRREGAVPTA